jgi:hypothetical protein
MVNMTYSVTTVFPVDPDESPNNPAMKIILPAPIFHSLSEAKKEADDCIERFGRPGTVVEVKQRNGRAKYRAERDAEGAIKRYPLV